MKVYRHFVKKLVTPREWGSHYSKLNSYYALGREGKMMWAGFMIGLVEGTDMDLFFKHSKLRLMDHDDLEKFNRHCKLCNIMPRPFDEEDDLGGKINHKGFNWFKKFLIDSGLAKRFGIKSLVDVSKEVNRKIRISDTKKVDNY